MNRIRSYLLYGLGVFIALYLITSLVQTIRKNYDLRTQVVKLEEEIDLLQIQQQELKYRIEYYQTEAFREKEARAKLGLQLPGESIIILPREQGEGPKKAPRPTPKSNWQQWRAFLFAN